jgi:ribose-phosphate pyrophosphokinase
MVSACKRAGAKSITCAIPYYGYARQERKYRNRAVPISAADIAQILEFQGVNKIITFDIHASAVTGCTTSKVSFDDYETGFIGIDWFLKNLSAGDNICVVAPDAGAAKRAKTFYN